MATMTNEQRDKRQRETLAMLRNGKGVEDIAARFGITPQAAWEFCSRRGWMRRKGETSAAHIKRLKKTSSS